MDEAKSSKSNRMKRKQIKKEHRENNEFSRGQSGTPLPMDQAIVNQQYARSRMRQEHPSTSSNRPAIHAVSEPLNLGAPTYKCDFCGALFWFAERLKSLGCRAPVFSFCCRQGRIKLPNLREPPEPLNALFDYNGDRSSRLFRANIRLYNSAFAFTSIGGKIDRDINRGQGPYVFKLNGQNHHFIGSLLPADGQRPQFAQLYIYDTDNEASNRLAAFPGAVLDGSLDEHVVSDLIKMFDGCNELVKAFRMARDRFKSDEICSFALTLTAKRSNNDLQYNVPTAPEMAGLIVGDLGTTNQGWDIIIEHKTRGMRRVDDLHPAFMAMQYPLLFPFGEDGYRLDIPYQTTTAERRIKRGHVTRREYYCYMLQHRCAGAGLLIKGGKLFQQYIVDAFTCIEDERLRYIRFKHQQEHYRCEIYTSIQDAFLRGDAAAKSIGQCIILPSSFTGSPRYMIQNYHDAMAICRCKGNPDLFITFTCNVQWPEIQLALALIPCQKIEDRPDIVSRVFHMKLTEFMADIKSGIHFGLVVGAIYTVEFQKRGLPHVHIIVWLHNDSKYPTPAEIDQIISAEIPDQLQEPALYSLVSRFMMHGPCGITNPNAPCMKGGRCMKHFPKKSCSETTVGEDGFAVYKRRATPDVVIKGDVALDHRFVVPYNSQLLLKYNAHVNVEWCNRSRAIKYLFKYINKGPDRTRALLRENTEAQAAGSTEQIIVIDEINIYMDCRYISPFDAICIASLLLPGGRTAHSRFKIPLDIHEQSTCHIKKGTLLAELIKNTALILWDEAPMAHRFCFEALDRTLADILETNENDQNYQPFGGKPILLGGDFRQILPVVVKGTRSDMIRACMTQSYLWEHCQLFKLEQNMRLTAEGLTDIEKAELSKFSQWLLDVGEGKAETRKMHEDEESSTWIKIPDNLRVRSENNKIEEIAMEIYVNLSDYYSDP